MLRRCFAGGWVAVAVVTTGAISACYPAFDFGSGGGDTVSSTGRSAARSGSGGDDPTTSITTGQGGMSTTTGAGGQGGDPTSTTSSTGAVRPGPTVACGPGTPEACNTGDVCCYHETTASEDKCSATTACGDGYFLLACDASADCEAGQVCCAAYEIDFFFGVYFAGVISCESSCGDPSLTMCETAADCGSGQTCAAIGDLDGSYATEYRACQ